MPGTYAPAGTALSLPVTGAALRRGRHRSLAVSATGLLLLLAAAGAGRSGHSPFPPVTGLTVLGPPTALLVLGASELVRLARMARCLTRHPWRSYAAALDTTPEAVAAGGPLLTLTDEHRRSVTHRVTGWSRYRARHRTGEVWIAGDPRRACVMAPPGGADLHRLRPVGPLTAVRLDSFGPSLRDDHQGVS
ncbi:hypothetical protein [Streptomyces albidoflavus]|uniref:hypothetical protein n=1 Tax=Streptomyces albidoflavus TaxID=1886 RepID=UPI0033B9D3DE